MSEYNKEAAELPSALWAGMEAAPSLAMDLEGGSFLSLALF